MAITDQNSNAGGAQSAGTTDSQVVVSSLIPMLSAELARQNATTNQVGQQSAKVIQDSEYLSSIAEQLRQQAAARAGVVTQDKLTASDLKIAGYEQERANLDTQDQFIAGIRDSLPALQANAKLHADASRELTLKAQGLNPDGTPKSVLGKAMSWLFQNDYRAMAAQEQNMAVQSVVQTAQSQVTIANALSTTAAENATNNRKELELLIEKEKIGKLLTQVDEKTGLLNIDAKLAAEQLGYDKDAVSAAVAAANAAKGAVDSKISAFDFSMRQSQFKAYNAQWQDKLKLRDSWETIIQTAIDNKDIQPLTPEAKSIAVDTAANGDFQKFNFLLKGDAPAVIRTLNQSTIRGNVAAGLGDFLDETTKTGQPTTAANKEIVQTAQALTSTAEYQAQFNSRAFSEVSDGKGGKITKSNLEGKSASEQAALTQQWMRESLNSMDIEAGLEEVAKAQPVVVSPVDISAELQKLGIKVTDEVTAEITKVLSPKLLDGSAASDKEIFEAYRDTTRNLRYVSPVFGVSNPNATQARNAIVNQILPTIIRKQQIGNRKRIGAALVQSGKVPAKFLQNTKMTVKLPGASPLSPSTQIKDFDFGDTIRLEQLNKLEELRDIRVTPGIRVLD